MTPCKKLAPCQAHAFCRLHLSGPPRHRESGSPERRSALQTKRSGGQRPRGTGFSRFISAPCLIAIGPSQTGAKAYFPPLIFAPVLEALESGRPIHLCLPLLPMRPALCSFLKKRPALALLCLLTGPALAAGAAGSAPPAPSQPEASDRNASGAALNTRAP